MRCPLCDANTPEGAKVCIECGVSRRPRCPQCGADVLPRAKFCAECGTPLTAQSPASPAAPSPSPLSYTPGYLAEKILTSKTTLEGERKQVTVLFADLKGSMELLADRDPEEARALLDPVLERMMEAVHRYEGTVNQVMGDGIMALFGAPIAHEDHPVRACYAALAMQEAIRRYSKELRRAYGIEVQIRVGLNSGEVVVRAIGSDLHMDYTAVGQTTHLAARMEQLALPGTIRLPSETVRLAEGFIEVTPLGPVPVKGLPEPVAVYELLRAGPVRSRLQAAVARGLTRFVGRGTELEQLQQALARAAAGQGQVVAGVGEAGVGKSRLFYEFTRSHYTHGWLQLASHSVSYGKATAYLPVLDLLKGYFQIEPQDDACRRREKVTGKLLTLERALEPLLPALLALLEVPVEDPQWQAFDPPQRRRRTLEALKHLLLRESQVQPLCLVFEDLHWIDAETRALLDNLVESLPTARLLLLVNYRPEYQHGWGSKTYYTQLRLDPLPPASADAFLQALLGHGPSLAPLTQLLIARTEGNPFFLEESVRTLVETGVLVGAPGAYRLAQALPTIQVPATVQAVLAARIDRLPPGDKALLQTASVVGKDVPLALLQAIDVRFDLRNALLPRAEWERIQGYLRDAEALARTLDDQRRLGWVLAYMSSHHLNTGGRASDVHTVAQQVEAIGDTLDDGPLQVAAQYYLIMACHLLGDYRATEHVCRRLMRSVQGERTRERFGLAVFPAVLSRAFLAPTLAERGMFDEGVAHGQEAIRMAEALDHPFSLTLACLGLAYVNSVQGDLSQAARLLERAVALGRDWNNAYLTPGALASLGHVYAWSGLAGEGVSMLQQALTAYESAGIEWRHSLSVMQLGEAYLLVNQIENARACADRALMLARERGERGHEAWALRLLGEVASRQSRPDVATAEAHYRDALALAEALGMRPLQAHCHRGLGTLYAKMDQREPARAELSLAIELYKAMEMTFWLPQAEAALAQVEGR